MTSSKRVKIIFPVPLSENTRELVEAQIPPEMIGDQFSVEFVGSGEIVSMADSYYDMQLMEMAVIEAGMRSEAEGFDAVCINTMSDSGLYALRSRLSIPVLSAGESALHLACMLGQKFSIVTMWKKWFPLYRKTIKEYGLEHKLASVRSIEVRPDTQELLQGKEDIVFDKLLAQAQTAIDQDGADVIVLGSTTMHQSYNFLKSNLSIPVINPGLVAYKFSELFINLGLTQSKLTYPAPETTTGDSIFAKLSI